MSLHMVGLLHVAPRSMGLLCSVPHPFCYRVAINIKKIIIMQSFTKREASVCTFGYCCSRTQLVVKRLSHQGVHRIALCPASGRTLTYL